MIETVVGRPKSVRSKVNVRFIGYLTLSLAKECKACLEGRLALEQDGNSRSELIGLIKMLDQRIQEFTVTAVPVKEPEKEVGKTVWEPLSDQPLEEKPVSVRPSVKLITRDDMPNFSGSQLRAIKSALYAVGHSEAVRDARLSPGLPFIEPFVIPVVGKHSVIALTTFRDDDDMGCTDYYNCTVNDVFLGKNCHIESPLVLKDPIEDREMYFYDGSIRGEKVNCYAIHAVDGTFIHFWKSSISKGDRINLPGGADFVVRVSAKGEVSFVPSTSRTKTVC